MNGMNKQSGFTLIEIMVVVVILGVLGALIVPNVITAPDEARVEAAKADIGSIGSALDMYRLHNSIYPSTEQGLEALAEEPSGFPEPRNWKGPYLQKVKPDPWGEPYYYFSEDRDFEIYSYGADRKEGGDGVDADISSRDL